MGHCQRDAYESGGDKVQRKELIKRLAVLELPVFTCEQIADIVQDMLKQDQNKKQYEKGKE
jgi:hypothetical protein